MLFRLHQKYSNYGCSTTRFLPKLVALTKTTHVEQYSVVDLTSAALSQAGKVVIITGANQGLGRKVSKHFPLLNGFL